MITKTDYVNFRTCPRSYYYSLNDKKEAKPTDEATQKRIDEGYLVNNYAHKYFANIAKVKQDNGVVDISLQAEITKKLLKDNTKVIAEASFIHKDLFCAVDILVKDQDGYAIYEVKGSTDLKNHLGQYCADVAFQKYVLEQCGLKVYGCYILHLNKEYIRNGDIDVHQLLIAHNLDEEANFQKESDLVKETINQIRIMQKAKDVPSYGTCAKDCEFYKFCHRDLPKPSILDINHMSLKKGHELIKQGIKSFADIIDNNIKLSDFQKIQIKTKNIHLEKAEIKEFLQGLVYPIYHLDFETMNEAIPPFNGVCPYQQIPFQYSLHIQAGPNAKPVHKEFLGNKLDSEYELAKQLCKDIPLNVTSMAYNMQFEKAILRHLANRFSNLKDHLMNIHDHMIDLLVPFKKGYYYNITQNGSNSIKYVMPAICPQMAEAYHQLPVVHNGNEALTMYPKMIKMTGKQYETIRQGMLDYCCLDTLSMVKVLDQLWKLSK